MKKRFEHITSSKWFKWFTNKYVLIALIFAVWMLAFDSNNFFIHQELNEEIETLEGTTEKYQQDIQDDKKQLEKLQDTNELEKYGREAYYLKKGNEDIFIITHEDSTDQKP